MERENMNADAINMLQQVVSHGKLLQEELDNQQQRYDRMTELEIALSAIK
jgi:hypothetical protein